MTEAARGRGAALDPYTAWIAAEMDLLPTLRAWFGTLYVSAACIRMIDRMIQKQGQGIGQRQMSVSWHDGQFIRHEVDDAFLRSQIAVLEAGKAKIVAACEVRAVLVPDHTSKIADKMLETAGTSILDAAFLASEHDVPLLSDDARFRAWGAAATGCRSTWLQAALIAAGRAGALTMPDYARAVVGLTARRHSFVTMNGGVLCAICRQDDEALHGLKAALEYVGGQGAEMVSHLMVVAEFLGTLWSHDVDMPLLRRKAATGLALDALLKGQRADWLDWLRRLVHHAPRKVAFRRYLAEWLTGHFIPLEAIAAPTE